MLRSDSEEPTLVKQLTESSEAKRAMPLRDNEAPMLRKSITASDDPKVDLPRTESEAARRLKQRIDIEAPTFW